MMFSRLWDATDDDGEFAYKYDDNDQDDDRGYESGLSRDSCYADDMEDDIYDYMDRPWIWPTFGSPKDCKGKRPAVTDLELAQFFDRYDKQIPDSELYAMGCAVDVYDAEFGRLFHSAAAAEQIWDRLRLFLSAKKEKESAPAPFVRDPEIW